MTYHQQFDLTDCGAAGGTAVIPIIGTVAGAAAMAGVGAVSGALVGAAGYFISIMFD